MWSLVLQKVDLSVCEIFMNENKRKLVHYVYWRIPRRSSCLISVSEKWTAWWKIPNKSEVKT